MSETNKTVRLRHTDLELKVLIIFLKDIADSEEIILREADRNDPRLVLERRRLYAAKEMLRRFSGALDGNKYHMRRRALKVCELLIKKET
jgi:hypothetical protein